MGWHLPRLLGISILRRRAQPSPIRWAADSPGGSLDTLSPLRVSRHLQLREPSAGLRVSPPQALSRGPVHLHPEPTLGVSALPWRFSGLYDLVPAARWRSARAEHSVSWAFRVCVSTRQRRRPCWEWSEPTDEQEARRVPSAVRGRWEGLDHRLSTRVHVCVCGRVRAQAGSPGLRGSACPGAPAPGRGQSGEEFPVMPFTVWVCSGSLSFWEPEVVVISSL